MNVFEDRVARVQGLLREEVAGLLVISPGSNMFYLSGFSDEAAERPLFLLLPPEGEPRFVVPELYADQVEARSPFRPTHVWRDADGPEEALRRALAELNVGGARVLVDDGMGARSLLLLEAALPDAVFSLASPLMRRMRMRKNPEELEALSEAAAIADRAFEELSQTQIVGLTELEVARTLEAVMLREGAGGPPSRHWWRPAPTAPCRTTGPATVGSNPATW